MGELNAAEGTQVFAEIQDSTACHKSTKSYDRATRKGKKGPKISISYEEISCKCFASADRLERRNTFAM